MAKIADTQNEMFIYTLEPLNNYNINKKLKTWNKNRWRIEDYGGNFSTMTDEFKTQINNLKKNYRRKRKNRHWIWRRENLFTSTQDTIPR